MNRTLIGLALFALVSGWLACGRPLTKDEIALDRYKLANELYAEGQYEKCIDHYEYILRIRDRIHDAYLKLSDCYERLSKPLEAIRVLERSLLADRYHHEVLRRLARLYSDQNEIRAAIRMNKRILERNPGDAHAKAELTRLIEK